MRLMNPQLAVVPPRLTATNSLGETPLLRAASMGPTATVQTLLWQGEAIVNHADQNGCTPLHYARCRATAQALLEAGADPTLADRHGNTPLHAAAMAGQVEVARLLSSLSSTTAPGETTTTPQKTIPSKKNTAAVLLLYARNVHGETPLDRCRVLRRTDVAQVLLQQYAHNVLAQHSDQPIRAVLQEAFTVNHKDEDRARKVKQLRVQLAIGTVSVEQLVVLLDLILQKDPSAIFGSFQAALQLSAPPQVLYYLLRQNPEALLRMDSRNWSKR